MGNIFLGNEVELEVVKLADWDGIGSDHYRNGKEQ